MSEGNPRVLVVDDDGGFGRLLALRLISGGFDVVTASSGADALTRNESFAPDVVVTDLRMEGMDGHELFAELRRRRPTLPVILLTAHGTIPDAVAATRNGVFAYLTKPIDSAELLSTVRAAAAVPTVAPSSQAAAAEPWREGILGNSRPLRGLLDRARRVADSDASVLITGESGTGKELLARLLHRNSRRRDGPFVALNCAAVPEGLLESELFGYRRGAFTGAATDHTGLLRAAEGGVLFLDELGDMPLAFQAKLLRVLEERRVRAIGATRSVPFDVRVISATHADLGAMAQEGTFREDLLYRLDVVGLQVPPLRERREDIPTLVTSFATAVAERDLRAAPVFAPEALDVLLGHAWPGNIRQLRNVVEYCVAMTRSSVIAPDTVREALREDDAALPTLESVRLEAEQRYLVQLLKLTRGNITQAARAAGRNRTEFYKLLGRHGLDPDHFREDE